MAEYRVQKTFFGYVCQILAYKEKKRLFVAKKMTTEFITMNKFGKPCKDYNFFKHWSRQPESICHKPFKTKKEAETWVSKLKRQ